MPKRGKASSRLNNFMQYRLALVFTVLVVPMFAEAPVVASVEVEGTTRHLELLTKAGEPLNPELLIRDVRNIWKTGAFDDVQVEQVDGESGSEIVFRVTEKPKYFLRKVEFSKRSPERSVSLQPGTVIDEQKAHAIAKNVERQLRENGYAHGKVHASLVPSGFRQMDLHLDVDAGDRYKVFKVNFTGDFGAVKVEELEKALRNTRVKRILGGIWKARPDYSEEAVDADLHRLRSVMAEHGYFDARVGFGGLEFQGDRVTLTYCIDAGKKYEIGEVEVAGRKLEVRDGEFPKKEFCSCLREEQRRTEKEGRLDFEARLRVEDVDRNLVNVQTEIETSEPVTVGRITFTGNHHYSDSLLRRTFVLDEGAPLDQTLLGRSLVRLNRLGVIEPVTDQNVMIVRNPYTRQADIVVKVKEVKRGRWSLSGPVGTVSMGGPLQGAVMSRLPAWGRGIFEMSTYVASFSVIGFANPYSQIMPFLPNRKWMPILMVERPFMEGQGWKSGFMIAPQLGTRWMLFNYGLSQAQGRLRNWIQGDMPAQVPIVLPIQRVSPKLTGGTAPTVANSLVCDPVKSRWTPLRTVGGLAAEILLMGRPF